MNLQSLRHATDSRRLAVICESPVLSKVARAYRVDLSRLESKLMDEQLTFASVAKRVFVLNYSYENACRLYVHSLECSRLLVSRNDRKSWGGTSGTWFKKKNTARPSPAFSIVLTDREPETGYYPSGLDASPSQGYLTILNLPVLIYPP